MKRLVSSFSFWPFVIVVLIILLNLYPYTALILMLAGYEFWIGCALLAFLAGLAIDCLMRKFPRALLIIPVGFLVTYYSMFFMQRIEIARTEARLQSSNPANLIAFDPKQHSLVSVLSWTITTKYGIPFAYSRDEDLSGDRYLSHRILPQEGCSKVVTDSPPRISRTGFSITDRQGRHVHARGMCMVQYPEQPSGQVVEVLPKGQHHWRRDSKIKESTYELLVDGKTVGVFRTASVNRYTVLPFPYVSCFFDSDNAEWLCEGRFRSSIYRLNATPHSAESYGPKDSPIAIMLGLSGYEWEDYRNFKGYKSNEASLAQFHADADQKIGDPFDHLLKLLADPSLEAPWRLGILLAQDKDRLAQEADLVVDALHQIATTKEPEIAAKHDKLREIATAVAALPTAEFAAHGRKIFEVVSKDTWLKVHLPLYIRAADAGAFTRERYRSDLLDSNVWMELKFAPTLALCRMPALDAKTLSHLKLQLKTLRPRYYQDFHQAVFLTLLRHGQKDFARQTVERQNPHSIRWYSDVMIDYESSKSQLPNNCMIQRWPRPDYLPQLMRARVPDQLSD